MTPTQMKSRTKQFALQAIKLVDALPETKSAEVIGRPLLRCSTSVAANYRAACRARSNAEFSAKLGIVEEEADESCFWLEMLVEAELMPEAKLQSLRDEADELTAIVVASIKTARQAAKNLKSPIRNPKSK